MERNGNLRGARFIPIECAKTLLWARDEDRFGRKRWRIFFTQDDLGSIRELTDAAATVRARYGYDPYGKKSKVSGDLEADFGFTGLYFHDVSALNLAIYRAYDAGLGRWVSRDPIQERGGINLYS